MSGKCYRRQVRRLAFRSTARRPEATGTAATFQQMWKRLWKTMGAKGQRSQEIRAGFRVFRTRETHGCGPGGAKARKLLYIGMLFKV
jgi:hypothetical protein